MNAWINRCLTFAVLLFPMLGACAAPIEDYYQAVAAPQPTAAAEGKIEVAEFFWYGCPHCYSLEPHINQWAENKPDDVEFQRMPAVLNKTWIPHARAYYTAEKLGILEQIHRPLFDALHRDRKRVFSDDELRDFFLEHGVDAATFDRVYGSSEVDTRVKQALILGQRYRLTGVPTIIVNGKYMTSGTLARSFDNMMEVINALVERERGATQ